MIDAIQLLRLLDLTHQEVLHSEVMRDVGAAELRVTEHTAAMEYSELGFSVAFKKADWTARRVPDETFVVIAIHIFVLSIDGYAPFKGALIYGLRSNDSRDDVHRALGLPSASGGGTHGMFKRWIDPWERFILNGYAVTVDYCAHGIKRLTLMTTVESTRLGQVS